MWKRQFILTVAVLACNASPVFDANHVIQSMTQKYSTCTTYRDTGVVHKTVGSADKTLHFETSFQRNVAFEFTIRSADGEFKVWTKEGHVFRYWSVDGKTAERSSIAEAVGEAAGISGGMSTIIPSLLGVGGQPTFVGRLTQLHAGGSENIDGQPCAIIEGLDKAQQNVRIFIGVNDAKVRRVERSQPQFGSKTVISYSSQMK